MAAVLAVWAMWPDAQDPESSAPAPKIVRPAPGEQIAPGVEYVRAGVDHLGERDGASVLGWSVTIRNESGESAFVNDMQIELLSDAGVVLHTVTHGFAGVPPGTHDLRDTVALAPNLAAGVSAARLVLRARQ